MGIEALLKDDKASAEFGNLYFKLYKEKICVGCRGKMRQKFSELMNTNQDKIKVMSQRKFILKAGVLIDLSMASKGPCGMYNAASMTDETAIELLRHHKGYAKNFEQLPEDWEKIVKATPVPKPNKTTKPTPEPEATTEDAPEDTEGETSTDRADAIDAIGYASHHKSVDMNAKDVIALLERIDSIPAIETFTSLEADMPKKRKTVLKFIKKRIRNLSE